MIVKRRPTIEMVCRESKQNLFQKKKKFTKGSLGLFLLSFFYGLCGLLLALWPPYDLILSERLQMRQGLPPFAWWANPPDSIVLRLRAFNYTNIEDFINGQADYLQLQELAPIYYKEHMTHHNIVRNPNDTISFHVKHIPEFIPEMNTLSLDDHILIPNYAALGIASFLHDVPFFVKMGLNILMRQLGTRIFLKMTLRDFLWNFTDPILSAANKLVPSLAPISNVGMLERIYEDFENDVTMYVGPKHGDELFSLIEKVDGSTALPNYKFCKDSVTNATEGVTYGQLLTKQSVIKYWRKTVCKVIPVYFNSEKQYMGLKAYEFTVKPSAYNRTVPLHDDCYRGRPTLPDGLSDMSRCYYDVPLAASFPHFINTDKAVSKHLRGLAPNESLHLSFILIEPTFGVPLQAVARSQSNLVVHEMSGFTHDVQKFSGLTLPMMWLEYNTTGLPWPLHTAIYTATVILPPAQIILCAVFLGLALYYFVKLSQRMVKLRKNGFPHELDHLYKHSLKN